MIVFERFGCTIKLKNKHWKNMRERFNPDNANIKNGYYYIRIRCSLCDEYKNGYYCGLCPFRDFGHGIYGCGTFILKILREAKFQTYPKAISWRKEINKSVRRQLKSLNNFMDKIEKENENQN